MFADRGKRDADNQRVSGVQARHRSAYLSPAAEQIQEAALRKQSRRGGRQNDVHDAERVGNDEGRHAASHKRGCARPWIHSNTAPTTAEPRYNVQSTACTQHGTRYDVPLETDFGKTAQPLLKSHHAASVREALRLRDHVRPGNRVRTRARSPVVQEVAPAISQQPIELSGGAALLRGVRGEAR